MPLGVRVNVESLHGISEEQVLISLLQVLALGGASVVQSVSHHQAHCHRLRDSGAAGLRAVSVRAIISEGFSASCSTTRRALCAVHSGACAQHLRDGASRAHLKRTILAGAAGLPAVSVRASSSSSCRSVSVSWLSGRTTSRAGCARAASQRAGHVTCVILFLFLC